MGTRTTARITAITAMAPMIAYSLFLDLVSGSVKGSVGGCAVGSGVAGSGAGGGGTFESEKILYIERFFLNGEALHVVYIACPCAFNSVCHGKTVLG